MQRLPANFRFQFCLFVGAFVHAIRCAAFVCRFYAVNCNVCRAFFHSDSDDRTACFRCINLHEMADGIAIVQYAIKIREVFCGFTDFFIPSKSYQ